jgi:hypothetical protein
MHERRRFLPNKCDKQTDAANARQLEGAEIINMAFANREVAIAA